MGGDRNDRAIPYCSKQPSDPRLLVGGDRNSQALGLFPADQGDPRLLVGGDRNPKTKIGIYYV